MDIKQSLILAIVTILITASALSYLLVRAVDFNGYFRGVDEMTNEAIGDIKK